jgi:hypothetical protein
MSEKHTGDPLERLQEKKAVSRRPLQRVRAFGMMVAWLGAVVCGWNVAQQSDLLSATLRGGAAWLGLLVIWMTGTTACEQLLMRSRPVDEQPKPEGDH